MVAELQPCAGGRVILNFAPSFSFFALFLPYLLLLSAFSLAVLLFGLSCVGRGLFLLR